jgi:transposase
VIDSEVAHFDETGMEVEQKRGGWHTASPPQLTSSAYHAQRGSVARQAIGLLPEFQGRAMHAAFCAYFQYDYKHGLCHAHLLRELIFVHKPMNRAWAGEMKQWWVASGKRLTSPKSKTSGLWKPLKSRRTNNATLPSSKPVCKGKAP